LNIWHRPKSRPGRTISRLIFEFCTARGAKHRGSDLHFKKLLPAAHPFPVSRDDRDILSPASNQLALGIGPVWLRGTEKMLSPDDAVNRRRVDVEGPGNGADRLPVSTSSLANSCWSGRIFLGRPKATTRALAANLPSVVRLKMRVRSNSAIPAKMVMTIRPERLVVSAHGSSASRWRSQRRRRFWPTERLDRADSRGNEASVFVSATACGWAC
jgi:hypothetical protein